MDVDSGDNRVSVFKMMADRSRRFGNKDQASSALALAWLRICSLKKVS